MGFLVSHSRRKNRDAPRVGHPIFVVADSARIVQATEGNGRQLLAQYLLSHQRLIRIGLNNLVMQAVEG